MTQSNTTQDFYEKFFALVRAGMDLETVPVSLSEEECGKLKWIGICQAILPILQRGLEKTGAPAEVVEAFFQASLMDMHQSVQHDIALESVSAVLDEAKIPYVLLKGAALRHLYPDFSLRTSSDIDVLVHETDLDRAVTVLERDTDFETRERGYHDVSMVSARVHLELHFSLKEKMESVDRILSLAWEYTEPAEGSRAVFQPDFHVFYLIAHMVKHFLNGGLGIRPILDLWLLRTKTSFDDETVCRMCSECGILKFYRECCALSVVWMKKAEHTETTLLLEEFCLSGGALGSEKFMNAGRQRKQRGWKYLFSRVFPPAYEVRESYKNEAGKEHALPYYYVKRLISWASKEKREDFRKEVQTVLSSDQEYLNKADKLFRLLEL